MSFAAALDAQFFAPGTAAAVYQPADGSEPLPVRVIRAQPDGLGPRNVMQSLNTFDLRKSDVTRPQSGDIIAIDGDIIGGAIAGGEKFELIGTARLDVEGLTWTIGGELLRD